MKNKTIRFTCLFFCSLMIHSLTHGQTISTVAGTGTLGHSGDNGPATAAEIAYPTRVAVDTNGNLYFGDVYNQRICRVDVVTKIITTIAGTGTAGFSGDNGPATAAEINGTQGLAMDRAGNLFMADVYNNRIRKIDPAGIITTVAGGGSGGLFSGDGGQATAAGLFQPFGVAVDNAGDIYIGDLANYRVRKVNAAGIISTIAGNGTAASTGNGGPATAAEVNAPVDVCVDKNGNVYIAELGSGFVRKINTSGQISAFAGTGIAGFSGDGGPATAAAFNNLAGLASDKMGNIFIMDAENSRLRIVDPTGIVNTYAGNGADGYNGDGIPATDASLAVPNGVVVDKWGNVYIADNNNYRVREITSPDSFYVDTTSTTFTSVLAFAPGPVVYVFPNPVYDELNVQITSAFEEPALVMLVNTAGETVKTVSTTTNKSLKIGADVAPGFYFVHVVTNHGKWSGNVSVVQR